MVSVAKNIDVLYRSWTGSKINMAGTLSLPDLLAVGNFTSVNRMIAEENFPLVYPGGYVQVEYLRLRTRVHRDHLRLVAKQRGLWVSYEFAFNYSVQADMRGMVGKFMFLHDPVMEKYVTLYREHRVFMLELADAEEFLPAEVTFPFYRVLA